MRHPHQHNKGAVPSEEAHPPSGHRGVMTPPPNHLREHLTVSSRRSPERRLSGPAITCAVVKRKGGIGATTIVSNLAAGLALHGYRVLAIEADGNPRLADLLLPLGSGEFRDDTQTSFHLFTHPDEGLGFKQRAISLAELLEPMVVPVSGRQGASPSASARGAGGHASGRSGSSSNLLRISATARQTLLAEREWVTAALPGANGHGDARGGVLHLIPGSERLSTVVEDTVRLANAVAPRADFHQYTQLALAIQPIRSRYDLILFDLAPNLGNIMWNVLLATQYLLLLVDFDPHGSIEDYQRVLAFCRQVQATAHSLKRPAPQILGVVYNKYAEHLAVHRTLREQFTQVHHNPETGQQEPPIAPHSVLGIIPRDEDLCTLALAARVPVMTYAPTTAIGEALYALCCHLEHHVQSSRRP